MRALAEQVTALLARQGWGLLRFDFAFAREGLIALELERSALAEAAPPRRARTGEAPQFACHLVAGAVGAILWHVASRRLVAREINCRASGAPVCAFVAVAAPRRAALDAALASGARGLDAVRSALRRTPLTPEAP